MTYNERLHQLAEKMAAAEHNAEFEKGKYTSDHATWKELAIKEGLVSIVENEYKYYLPVARLALAEMADAVRKLFEKNHTDSDGDYNTFYEPELQHYLQSHGLVPGKNETNE